MSVLKTHRILILEKDRHYFDFITEQLSYFGYDKKQFLHLKTYEEVNSKSKKASSNDIIFACFNSESDNEVLKEITNIQQAFRYAAVIVFSERDDDELAIKCVRSGAQGFLAKGIFTSSELYRTTIFSAERNRLCQKRAIEDVKNNQAALINSSNQMIWSVDADMKLLSYNEAYAKRILELSGNPVEERMQLPVKSHSSEKQKRWQELYGRGLRGESFTIQETIENPRSGQTKNAQINFFPFRGADDHKIIGVACYSQDITPLEEAKKVIETQYEQLTAKEENLQKITTTLQKVMDSSLDVICSLDESGRFLQVSNASQSLWGYEPDEIIGKSAFDFVAPGFLNATKEAAANTLEGKIYMDFQNFYVHKQGHMVPLLWSARWDKEERIMYCVARDGSTMKEAENLKLEQEQRIDALLRNCADMIGVIDSEANYLYISPNVKTLLGYDPEFLMGINALQLIHPEDVNTALEELKKVLEKGERKLAAFRYKNANNEWRWIETVASNQLHNPAIRGIVVSSRDITGRKQGESERELMIKELLKSNADLKQFSFITSHNLRAPLSNITGILNILDYDELNEYNRQMITMLDKSVKQLSQTIDDLAKILIVKNNVNVEIANIDLAETFQQVKSVFVNTLNDVCAHVITNFHVDHIPFNPTYFESIMVNLISNAIKYRSTNRSLVIKVTTCQGDNDDIVLEFSDNGIGIDMKRHQNKVFGLYQRFHDHIDGQGLGLFIIKSQIVALGGKIDMRSEVDKGTTFIIRLKKGKPDLL